MPTAYLTNDTLQELVFREQGEAAENENEEEEGYGGIEKSAIIVDDLV